MNAERQGTSQRLSARARAWTLVPFLILGGGLAGLGVMTSLAVDDPSFALEEDYYRKAVEIDRQREQEAINRQLGWHLRVRPSGTSAARRGVHLALELEGPEGPLDSARITAEAFHNARAADVRNVAFEPEGEGRYFVRLSDVRPGLWEIRLRVEREGEVFTQVERLMLVPGGEGS